MNSLVIFSTLLAVGIVATVMSAEWKRVTATTGNGDKVILDIALDTSLMKVFTYKADDSEMFIETENLHIFDMGAVIVKDNVNKKCYAQGSNLTYETVAAEIDALQQGVTNELSNIQEEVVDISKLSREPDSALSLGEEVANFCKFHDLYILNEDDFEILNKSDLGRHRRQVSFEFKVTLVIKF